MPEGQAPEGTTATPLPGSAAATANITALGVPANAPVPTGPSAPAQPQTPVSQPAAGQAPAAGEGQTKTFDEKYVQGIRDEAASYRVKLREAEEKLRQKEQEGMSEVDKLKAQLKQVEDDARNAAWKAREGEIKAAAAALGCRKPELIVKLVDDDKEDIQAAVAEIKKSTPELFLNSIGTADGGAGGGVGSGAGRTTGQSMNQLIRQAAGRA